jgi:hypothetical protein
MASIEIEGFRFELLYKTSIYQTYTDSTPRLKKGKQRDYKDKNTDLVKIRSTNLRNQEVTLFWVYASMSELGVWRLLCTKGGGSFIKGADYTQSSCVNIQLQQYIWSVYERIPEINVRDGSDLSLADFTVVSKPDFLPFVSILNDEVNQPVSDTESIKSILNDGRRILNILPAKTITSVTCGDNVDENQILSIINNISISLEKNYNVERVTELFTYTYDFQDIIRTINTVVQVNLSNKKTVSKKYILYYKKIIFIKLPISARNAEYESNIDLITREGNINFVPFLLIPDTSICMNNGLYTEFINLGIYLCKPFEYNRQLLSEEIISCTGDYAYVGNRYIKDGAPIFPMNIQPASAAATVTDSADIIKNIKTRKKGGKKQNKTKRKQKQKRKKTIKRRRIQ